MGRTCSAPGQKEEGGAVFFGGRLALFNKYTRARRAVMFAVYAYRSTSGSLRSGDTGVLRMGVYFTVCPADSATNNNRDPSYRNCFFGYYSGS